MRHDNARNRTAALALAFLLTLLASSGPARAEVFDLRTATVADMQTRARFRRITNAGLRESHVHDVAVTREAPNYRMEG